METPLTLQGCRVISIPLIRLYSPISSIIYCAPSPLLAKTENLYATLPLPPTENLEDTDPNEKTSCQKTNTLEGIYFIFTLEGILTSNTLEGILYTYTLEGI